MPRRTSESVALFGNERGTEEFLWRAAPIQPRGGRKKVGLVGWSLVVRKSFSFRAKTIRRSVTWRVTGWFYVWQNYTRNFAEQIEERSFPG